MRVAACLPTPGSLLPAYCARLREGHRDTPRRPIPSELPVAGGEGNSTHFFVSWIPFPADKKEWKDSTEELPVFAAR